MYGRLFYTTYEMRTLSIPPLGMQTIPSIYFMYFQVLPILRLMSDILFTVRIPLSQLTSSLFTYLCGFINMCRALNRPPRMEVFLHFFTFSHFTGPMDQILCTRWVMNSPSSLPCLNFLPTNYEQV